MIARLETLRPRFLDSEGRRRLTPLRTNFADLAQKFNRSDCRPDFEDDKRLKPRFDVIFGDFGYNTDQLGRVEGLSYLGIRL